LDDGANGGNDQILNTKNREPQRAPSPLPLDSQDDHKN